MGNSDYSRIERAIRFLDEHAAGQPSLREVARSTGLSEFHFQRLFKRWAGVSPKRFVQFATAAQARALLRKTSVLHASVSAGLSGAGRLHDLVVNVDAVTPGELRRGGEGVVIRHAFEETPFGDALVARTERGLCGLTFVTEDRAEAVLELRARWPRATLIEDTTATSALARALFGEKRREITLHLRGSNFQLKIWEALLRIPEGALTTYGTLAASVGMPGASRAVGTAIGRNPIAVLIPCHRVIRETGAFGGYRWGLERKKALLLWEQARTHHRSGGVEAASDRFTL